MAGSPKVSVIIGTCNRADMLPRAVASVLSQTHEDHELIIVDDRSTDDTPQVVASFRDPRIRSVRLGANGGVVCARNTGIRMARGEYVAFLDDDDECTPNRLTDQVSVLDSNPGVGLVYGWCEEVNDETGHCRVLAQDTHRGRAAFDAALTGLSPVARMHFPMFRTDALRQVAALQEGHVQVGEDAIRNALVTRVHDADVVERIVGRRHINHMYEQSYSSPARDSMRRYAEAFWEIFQSDLRERPGVEAEWRAGNAVKWMMARAVAPALGELARVIRLRPLDPANARRVIQVTRAFLWYATPLRHFARRARNMRSRLLGSRMPG